MAQNFIYSPWERSKSPWLWLMTTLLLFNALWLFFFVSAFLISLIKRILSLLLKFSMEKKADRKHGEVGARVIGTCSVSLSLLPGVHLDPATTPFRCPPDPLIFKMWSTSRRPPMTKAHKDLLPPTACWLFDIYFTFLIFPCQHSLMFIWWLIFSICFMMSLIGG